MSRFMLKELFQHLAKWNNKKKKGRGEASCITPCIHAGLSKKRRAVNLTWNGTINRCSKHRGEGLSVQGHWSILVTILHTCIVLACRCAIWATKTSILLLVPAWNHPPSAVWQHSVQEEPYRCVLYSATVCATVCSQGSTIRQLVCWKQSVTLLSWQ